MDVFLKKGKRKRSEQADVNGSGSNSSLSRLARKGTFENYKVLKEQIFYPIMDDIPKIKKLFYMLKF